MNGLNLQWEWTHTTHQRKKLKAEILTLDYGNRFPVSLPTYLEGQTWARRSNGNKKCWLKKMNKEEDQHM